MTLARLPKGEDSHAAVKVHAVDTNRWIIFDAQIDVLANTESEVAVQLLIGGATRSMVIYPVSEKFFFRSSYSLTLSPLSRISSAFGPRTVTWTAIFSLRRMPNVRTV